MAHPTLSAVDYVLLVILLLSSAVIGAIFGFFKSKKSSAKEFLLADGGMGVVPTALSIMVSFLSAITLLGTPSEIYMFGTMYCYQAISWTIASTVTALVFMPKFREMNCTSAYEYLEKRFDRSVRMCASFTFSFFMLIYMAIVLYAPALALSQTTGLNIWLSVVSIGVICTFYSSVGGMKAVIWTDVLQAVVILVGLLATIIKGLIVMGGFGPVFSIASKGGRIQFDSVSFDPRVRHTVWSLLIGGTFNSLATYGFNQTQVQRYMCVRSTRAAKQALFINAIGAAIVILLSGFIGVILYAYYADCDPYTAKYVTDIDQVFPYFVMERLSENPGLPGIFLACIFSGSLSTISSGLNALAAVIIEDVYKGLMRKKISDERQGLVSKLFSIVLGVVVVLLTYVVSFLGSVLNAALSLFGVLSGPIMGVFFLGFFFPQANRHGGRIGFLASLCLQLWIFLGAQITKKQMKSESLPFSISNCSSYINQTITAPTSFKRDPLLDFYSISYMWYTPIAVGAVIIVGLIVSYLTHPLKPNEVDPKYLISIGDVCCCCLPQPIRKWFRFGVDYDDYYEDKENNDRNDIEMKSREKKSNTSGPNRISPAPSMPHNYDNQTLTTLDLHRDNIGDAGAQYLAVGLRQNKTLTTLNLYNNSIGDVGAQHLADVIQDNTALTSIDLGCNKIGHVGAKHLADGLRRNTTLTILGLGKNQIKEVGAKYLADGLRHNLALSTLYLFESEIGEIGAQHLGDALRHNIVLTELYLPGNEIGDVGAQHLANELRNNTTLVTLDLANNRIGDVGAQHLTDALQYNTVITILYSSISNLYFHFSIQTLTWLELYNNQIGDDAMNIIHELVERNERGREL
ncbi:unnamed protein product [Adineta steineri]|uniref:Uncharacterized protein n=1 Tax=Adineta steineri TaxID=433720 RepID=A0A819ACE3_9BILA|nr:unnamed protein product [Adineta steineri]CAF3777694.1 unnamed protein product [Adineta steineri]